jgi:hypothetical protein
LHDEAKRIIPTIPFFIRTHFLWRSDLCKFKELLIPSKIADFLFSIDFK